MKLSSFEIVNKGATYLLMKQLPPLNVEGPFDSLIIQVSLPKNVLDNYSVHQVVDIELRKVAGGSYTVQRIGECPSDKRIFEILLNQGFFVRFNKTQFNIGNVEMSLIKECEPFQRTTSIKVLIQPVKHQKIAYQNAVDKKTYHTASIGDIIGNAST